MATKNPYESYGTKEIDSVQEVGGPELGVLQGWWRWSNDSARKQQWDWFVIDQFLSGNHSIKGSPNDNTVVVSKGSDEINFPINKLYSTFRSVRAFVTRHKPVVGVEPESYDDGAVEYARRANKILERDNQLNNFRVINKEWVYFGVKYGVGYRQVGYDTEKKCCIRWTVDPNDLVIGSAHGEMEDAPYIIKTYTRTVEYMDKKYPKAGGFTADNELSPNEYKKLSLQIKFQQTGTQPDGKNGTVTNFEAWYRVLDKNALGGTINKCVFTMTKKCHFEETPFTEYPFIPYKADVVPNEASGDGHLRHVIPAQRMLDLLNTQMLEYNHIVNRGRFLLDKNSGFRVINTKEGQLIFRNPGKKVESLPPPQINPLLDTQLRLSINFIEDLGGQHDASQGGVPERVSSGDAIEQLQLGDSNNISDLRDNFEDALAKEAAWILKMYSIFEKDGLVINSKSESGQPEAYAVVGAQAREKTGTKVPEKYYHEDNGEYYDVLAILPDNHVKVSVTSQLGETKQARIELLTKLVELGVIPGKSLLEHLEFPNVSDLMQKLGDEAAAEAMMENVKNQQGQQQTNSGPSGANAPASEGPPPPAPVMENQDIMGELTALRDQTGAMING